MDEFMDKKLFALLCVLSIFTSLAVTVFFNAITIPSPAHASLSSNKTLGSPNLNLNPPPPPPTGWITVIKKTIGGDDIFGFAFNDVGGLNPAYNFQIRTFGGTGLDAIQAYAGFTYSVKETSLPSGWGLVSNTCNNLQVVADQTIECTITNAKIAQPTPVPTAQ